MKKAAPIYFSGTNLLKTTYLLSKFLIFAKVNQLIVASQSYFLRPAACLEKFDS